MNILFDIFVRVPELIDEMKSDDKVIFDEIVNYFSGRLEPLKSAMETEEGKKACAIMIHFLPPDEEFSLPPEQQSQEIRVSINGYSPQLTEKINGSFNTKDGALINEKLTEAWKRFNN